MLHLDHYDMIAQNMYETTFKISQETGLGNYDGGWFPKMGVGAKMIPFGCDQFLEVAGFVDTEMFKQLGGTYPFAKWLAHRQAFFLWSLRTDSMEELEELAARLWLGNRSRHSRRGGRTDDDEWPQGPTA